MKDNKIFNGRTNNDDKSAAPVEVPKNRTGHITGCELLNVRREPSISSPIVAVLNSSDSVMIREKNNVSDFFKVTTANGVSGYCMKKYIAFND